LTPTSREPKSRKSKLIVKEWPMKMELKRPDLARKKSNMGQNKSREAGRSKTIK